MHGILAQSLVILVAVVGIQSSSLPEQIGVCPPGFVTLPGTDGCYRILLEGLDWETARTRCTQIAPGAHLVVVTNLAQDQAIMNYIRTIPPSEATMCYWPSIQYYWTSGQKVDPSSCSSAWAWKPDPSTSIPFSYTNWGNGQPSCDGGIEACLHYASSLGHRWNDMPCYDSGCPICQIDKPSI
jgi:hypothetical protein